MSQAWSADSAPWGSDLTKWNGNEFVPATTRLLAASADTKLFLMDSSAAFDGALPDAYLERRGLTFDDPESIKLVKGIRGRIVGETGATVLIYVGSSNDPYDDPVYGDAIVHTIGDTLQADCFISGRYIAIKFATGSAYTWRLDSFSFIIETAGTY